ncbi:DNA starvation/stationary phase protection protein [Paenibacillus sp. UNC499MF]|uniref:Dps family protein n=1 Tax=Paenibacillus sp. UNC499MF TaxID=1502751 RepID=UPI0008A062E0|nr:DNA starvation/stationary phase protection protein [Paenibacillus sp. UNC499MF]SEF96777.1 starvation-inducible DNA-binding protein [Paenibacillus sp. UNC499MF]
MSIAIRSAHKVLNKQVANWTVLYVKLHNYHWYVKGDQFFTLHVKFEELYNEAAGYVDELAERLLAIGGKPVATLKECLELSDIGEASGSEKPDAMVRALLADFETVINECKTGMKEAVEAGDEGTSDMLLGITQSLEKHRWMLGSFLNG